MGIRIQPKEIEVSKDKEANPFENDLLGRKDSADVLTRIIRELEGPCVMAIDAEWGAGKTTFLDMWAQHMRNADFSVVKFNAWETDFAGDPLVALLTELTRELGQDNSESIRSAAKDIILRTAPSLLGMIPVVGQVAESAIRNSIDYAKEDKVSAYEKVRDEMVQFKVSLAGAAANLSQCNGGLPLVVVIDELDRCRPSYAVQLPEVAKHLFMVDHIVFVLAVNRTELAHSVKVLYGNDFDAEGYLRRFFDIDFHLPAPDRDSFVSELISTMQIDQYLSNLQVRMYSIDEIRVSMTLLRNFLALPSLSLRRVTQAAHRFALMLSLIDEQVPSLAITMVVALMLRTVDRGLYSKFVTSNVSDLEVANTIFSHPNMSDFRQSREGMLIEATIVVAMRSRSIRRFEDIDSELLRHYQENLPGNYQHIFEAAERLWLDRTPFNNFMQAMQSLELLSGDTTLR